MSFNESRSSMWMMSLNGVGALDLYLAAISRNMDSLKGQVALLRVAIAEREDLLRVAIAEREDLLRKSAADSDEDKDGPE